MRGILFSSLADAILASVAWYEQIGVVTTHTDIAKFLWRYKGPNISFAELDAEIEKLIEANALFRVNGFISSVSDNDAMWRRHDKRIASQVKMKKVMRFARLLSFVPGIRTVALCNTSGLFLANAESDIDFFIIAKRGLTWWVRLWAVACVYASGNKRHENGEKDAICLSYIVDDTALDISSVALEPTDSYLAFWCIALYPVCDDGAYGDFIEANRYWVLDYFSEWKPVIPNEYWFIRAKSYSVPSVLGVWSYRLQRKKAEMRAGSEKTSVIVSESVCKMHTHDNRRAINDVWFDILKKRGISYEM